MVQVTDAAGRLHPDRRPGRHDLDNKTTHADRAGAGRRVRERRLRLPADAGDHGTIGDTVWLDADAQRRRWTPASRASPGVTVALIQRPNGNGVWDAGEPIIATDITDANGLYPLHGLPCRRPAHDYLVWVNDTANVLGDAGTTTVRQQRATATATGNDQRGDRPDDGRQPAAGLRLRAARARRRARA